MSDKCFIMIQTTPNEKEKIKQDAHAHNCNLSEYIRYLVAKERDEMCIRTPQNDEVRE